MKTKYSAKLETIAWRNGWEAYLTASNKLIDQKIKSTSKTPDYQTFLNFLAEIKEERSVKKISI